MNAVPLVTRLHQHRMWVNQRLLTAAESLNEEQLRQAFQMGQGSVWKSLLHLYAAEYVWLEALEGNPSPVLPGDRPDKLPGNQEAEGAIPDLAKLQDNWSALDARWEYYLAHLRDGQLDEMVAKTSTRTGPDVKHLTRKSDILLHVCTHAQYTTAQAVNMLRQLGVESLPDVMLISLARSEAVPLS